MKRIFMTLVAAAALMFAACGGSTTNNGAAQSDNATEAKADSKPKAPAEPIWPVDATVTLGKTFDHEKFTLQYPASLSDFGSSGSMFDFKDDAKHVEFGGEFFEYGLGCDLKSYAAQYDEIFKFQGYQTHEEPVITGNTGFVIRAKNDMYTCYRFVLLYDENIGVRGMLEFPNSQAAEYDKTLGAILNSIKFK